MIKLLNDLKVNQEATIENIDGDKQFLESLTSIGFIPGTSISLISKLPFKGPIACKIWGTKFAIRHSDACKISVSLAV